MKVELVGTDEVRLVMSHEEAVDLLTALGTEVRRRQQPGLHQLSCWACDTAISEAAGALGAAGIKESSLHG